VISSLDFSSAMCVDYVQLAELSALHFDDSVSSAVIHLSNSNSICFFLGRLYFMNTQYSLCSSHFMPNVIPFR
jgi:hypothetical protein